MFKQALVTLAALMHVPIAAALDPVTRAQVVEIDAGRDQDPDPQRLTLRYANKTKFRFEVTLTSITGCDTSGFNKNPISVSSQKTAVDRGNFEMCAGGSVEFKWHVKIYSSFLLVETLKSTEDWTYRISNIGPNKEMKGTFTGEYGVSGDSNDAGKFLKGGWLAMRAQCGDQKIACNNAKITYSGLNYSGGASLTIVSTWKPVPPTGLYRCTNDYNQRCSR